MTPTLLLPKAEFGHGVLVHGGSGRSMAGGIQE
jgi:hypothetical protein